MSSRSCRGGSAFPMPITDFATFLLTYEFVSQSGP